MEKIYQAPEAIVVEFEENDLIRTSGEFQVVDKVDPDVQGW